MQDIYAIANPTTGSNTKEQADDDDEALEQKTDENHPDSGALWVVCHACAMYCHGYNDKDDQDEPADDNPSNNKNKSLAVQYLGTARAYCDCCTLTSPSCQLVEPSRLYVQSLWPCTTEAPQIQPDGDDNHKDEMDHSLFAPHQRRAYQIPQFLLASSTENDPQTPSSLSLLLRQQAMELVQHSKETFWIPFHQTTTQNDILRDDTTMCALERVACQIGQQHMDSSCALDGGGVEWWVQVKDLSTTTTTTPSIDLHFDKDEVVAESFGVGLFPTWSTVTYLTGLNHHHPVDDDKNNDTSMSSSMPTLVVPHCYHNDQQDDETHGRMDQMWVSYPHMGRHIVFDGQWLHGAPYHAGLSRPFQTTNTTTAPPRDTKRITFLVNVWTNQGPAGVQPLPPEIRQALLAMEQQQQEESCVNETPLVTTRTATTNSFAIPKLCFEPLSYPTVHLTTQVNEEEETRERIDLPFVTPEPSATATATTITSSREDEEETSKTMSQSPDSETDLNQAETNEDDDETTELGMVLRTYIPPMPVDDEASVFLVQFGPFMEAFLAYPGEEEEEDHDDTNEQVEHKEEDDEEEED